MRVLDFEFTLVAFLLLLMLPAGNPVEAASDLPPVEIKLTLTWKSEENGKIPYFDMAVTNVSDTPIRALDVRNRPDFIDSFCDVQIAPLDKSFELSRMISDPNIIDDADYVWLAPGESVEFKAIKLPIDYRELVPGKYTAQGVYRIDPIRRPLLIYKSEEIVFEME